MKSMVGTPRNSIIDQKPKWPICTFSRPCTITGSARHHAALQYKRPSILARAAIAVLWRKRHKNFELATPIFGAWLKRTLDDFA